MGACFEICQVQIPLDKILDYRVMQREYIYRPAYYVTNEFLIGKRYRFSHMVPYAAIYEEAVYSSADKAFKALSAGQAAAIDAKNALFSTLGDKLNIKVWKYSKYTCRNQAGRVFTTYIQDIPACIETAEGKRSEVYPHDELYKQLGEPIAPSIEFIPALLILTKDELFTFYGNGIQIDTDAEYERLKESMAAFEQEKASKSATKAFEKAKAALPKITAPKLNISLPQFRKAENNQPNESAEEFIEADYTFVEQDTFDAMDLNHDGVVDEKDLELFKEMMEKK